MRRRLPTLFGLSVICATWTSTARADNCEPQLGFSTCVDVDNLYPHAGNGPFVWLAPTSTAPAGEVSFGITASYQRRPYRLEVDGPSIDNRDVYVVDNLLDATFALALGITDRFEITIATPFTLYQDGAGYYTLQGTDDELPRSIVRDPRLGFALALVDRGRSADADGLELTARFEFAAPLGDGDHFGGARTGTFIPSLSAAYRVDFFEASLELAGRIRGTDDLGDVRWGTQLYTAAGVSFLAYRPLGLSFSAEAFAAPVLAEQQNDSPMLVPSEWMASSRIAPFLAGDVYLQVGGGSSIPLTASQATSSEVRVLLAGGYAPQALDTDHDGVLDRDDRCPNEREDRDGFEDADGCLDPDNDGDRIPDTLDRCRDAAETVDGFQDDDGCPDLDDDRDGIPDEEDRCRNEKEDKDGFEDDDGCPDPDNDGDTIPDDKDTCPLAAEDLDGHLDNDGCPDLDDDHDGVPDAQDKCQGLLEDMDGFEDDDGCPDPDNDGDGVLDGKDQCKDSPETLDGVDDDDGCPEPGATTLVRLEKDGRVTFLKPTRFKPNKAQPTPELVNELRIVAKLVLGRGPGFGVLIEGFPDKGSDARAEALASERAQAAKQILVEAGVRADLVNAVSGDLSAARPADAVPLDIAVHRESQ
ncbi:MAG: thrombospondin [Polyangiaceae bacterium]